MNWMRVSGWAFRVPCYHCGDTVYTGRQPVWADLDGEPFKAYYCENCKNKLENKLEEETK